MAYQFFIAGTRLPVTPGGSTISIPSRNETVTLINDGDINILKKKGLKEFSFEVYLPHVRYPFASYTSGYENADGTVSDIIPPLQYLQLFEKLKDDRLPFQLDIYRELPSRKGGNTWCTNETVALEDYEVVEDAENGCDVVVNINLKQYVHYRTQKVVLSEDGLTYSTVRDTDRKVNRIVQAREGDTLTSLLLREFGYCDSELMTRIWNLNSGTFVDPDGGALISTLPEGMSIRLVEV